TGGGTEISERSSNLFVSSTLFPKGETRIPRTRRPGSGTTIDTRTERKQQVPGTIFGSSGSLAMRRMIEERLAELRWAAEGNGATGSTGILVNEQFCTQTDQIYQRTSGRSAFSHPNHRRLIR